MAINKTTEILIFIVGDVITNTLINLKQTDYVSISSNQANTLVLTDASLNSGKAISLAS